MKTKRILSSLILTIGLLFATITTTFAMPPLPSSFYGTVKVNGANAPAGAILSARINGVEYARSTVGIYLSETVYSLEVTGDDLGTPDVIEGGKTGNTVVFYVDGVLANQTGTWNSGSNVRLNLTVTAATNHAPVANAQSVSTAEDSAKAITLTGTDADGDPLTYSIVIGPLHGSLSGTAPNVTYTPAADYNGPDSFTFKVYDGTLYSTPATVSITVTAVNDAPVANAQSASTSEDTAKAITLTGTDVDGDTLTYSIVAAPSHGILSGSAPALTYTPAANYNGPDSFTFKVNDGTLNSAPATVSITVRAVNNAPIITEGASISVSMSASTPFNLTLHAADADGDTITWSNTPAGHGTASASGTGPSKAIIYTPTLNFIGSDSFVVQVSDGNGGTDTIIVNVTITAVEPIPFTSFLPIIVR